MNFDRISADAHTDGYHLNVIFPKWKLKVTPVSLIQSPICFRDHAVLWDPLAPLESLAEGSVWCKIRRCTLDGLNATYTFIMQLLLFSQGRPGSDGARGMPGQSGPKVPRLARPNALRFNFIQNKCVFLKRVPKQCFPSFSGRQRLRWSGWTSWRKRKQSESSCGMTESLHMFMYVLMCPPAKFQCFAVVGWIWTLRTPWRTWRGWRKGKAGPLWLCAESYSSILSDTTNQHQNFPSALHFSC